MQHDIFPFHFALTAVFFSVSSNKLQELRIILLGQKTVGKSATGNTLLHKEVFASSQNEQCQMQDGEVSGRRVTVIDTPGWWQDSSCCTDEIDKEIARGFSLSPAGVHVILLVIPLDLTFRDSQRVTLEDHMNLFHATVWKHAMVLFTYGDKLADKSLEEHIEREHSALRWLIEKCENRYHAINNMKKMDMNQVTELFEKIEEIVAGNSGKLFCPNMNEMHLRFEEMFKRKQLKHVLKQRLVREYGRRELELMKEFKETLHELQNDIRGGATGTKSKSLGEYFEEDNKYVSIHPIL
uniref:GTPase IMAP family member 8 n=1 Tax=Astatotilapia calliptera TaxID=8154 RepID=A0AAX7VNE9_ASTCA